MLAEVRVRFKSFISIGEKLPLLIHILVKQTFHRLLQFKYQGLSKYIYFFLIQ